MKKLNAIICVVLILSLSGCLGTIFSGGPRNITLTTQNGKQVKVEVVAPSGIQQVTAPTTISIPPSSSSITIRVKDPCYDETTTIVAPKYNIIAIADFLFGLIGTTGYSVDMSTGNNWTYDNSALVIVNPNNTCKIK